MSLLFSPLALGPVMLTNRIAIAPMAQYAAHDGCAGIWHLQHLMQLAMSGAGLVMVESTAVERAGRAAHSDLGLYDDLCEEALAHALGAARGVALPNTKFGIQLGHTGRKGSVRQPWEGGRPLRAREDPWPLVAPTALPFAKDWPIPRAADDDDIAELLSRYRSAARRAARLGFDVVEIHMAHGYLLHSFQSPVTNKRDDCWGGDAARRMAFPLAVARAVAAELPQSMALGARITGSDWLDDGLTANDAAALATELKLLGFHYVCVSSGGIVPNAKIDVRPNYQVGFAGQVRRNSGITTRAVGMILRADQAESILRAGDADQIALARAVINNPRWVWHAASEAGVELELPARYARVSRKTWSGHPFFVPPERTGYNQRH